MPTDISLDGISGLSPEFQKAYQMANQAEQKALEPLTKRKETLETKLELLGDFSSRIDNLRQSLPPLNSPFAIRDFAFNSDDPKVITGSADKNVAQPGKHSMEILQLAGTASGLSNALPDKDETTLGTGYLTYETKDGDVREVFIDAENSTLEGISRAINSANLGIRASVVNDGSDPDNPFKLLVSTQAVGSDEDIHFPEFYLVGGEEDLYMETQQDARNAVLRYQGFEIQSATNEIKDLIPGATLNLKGITDPGKPTTVTIEQDIPKTAIKMKDFVEKTNQILTFIQQNQNSRDQKENANKPLGGEYSLLLSQDRIHNALKQNFLGDDTRTIRALSDIGIQFNRSGTLTFDEKKFELAMETNYSETVDLLSGDGVNFGLIPRMAQALNSISRSGEGLVTNQRQGLSNQIELLEKQAAQKEKYSTQKMEALKQTLSKAQASIDSLKNQSGYFQGGQSLIPGA